MLVLGPLHKMRFYVFGLVVVLAAAVLFVNVGNYLSFAFPVSGYSMRPAIVGGDLALVQPVSISTVHVGDVVVYRDGAKYVIHRVVEIDGSADGMYLIVKGDNNSFSDPAHVTATLLVGRVDVVVHYLGDLVTWPYNYVLAIVLICLLLADYGIDRARSTTDAYPEPSQL